MKYIALYTAILLLLPIASALDITEPTSAIQAQTLPIDVNMTWTGNSTSYTVELTTPSSTVVNTTTNQTTATYSLSAGNYTLTVTGTNESDQQTFSVSELPEDDPIQLTIETTENSYDVGDTITLSATASEPTTATLTILRSGNVEETYTLSITSTLSLIYIPEDPGTYEARLQADGITATTTWSVTSPDPLVVDFTYTTPYLDEETEFTAQVSGGETPYTYQWLFGTSTGSTGSTATHYFTSTGVSNTTLIVTDAQNSQQSITKTFTVQERTYDVEITLLNNQNEFLEEFIVRITDEDGNTEDEETGAAGTVDFENVDAGNYTVVAIKNSTTYLNETLEVTEDLNRLYTIDYELETTETEEAEEIEEVVEQEESTEEVVEESAPALLQTQELQAEEDTLDELKTQAKDRVREKKFSLRLDSTQDEILTHLDTYSEFDAAVAQIDKATTEEGIETITDTLPTEVQIQQQQRKVLYVESEELQDSIQQYFDALGIEDEEEQKRILYNIKRVEENVSITQTTYLAKLVYPDKTYTYSFVKKDITAPRGSEFIEIIPSGYAASANDLVIEGDHTELGDEAQLLFTESTYAYAAQTSTIEPGVTIVLPEELMEPPLFSGLISFEVGESNITRTIIYIFIIAVAVAGVVVGKRMSAGAPSGSFDAFCELTNEALEQINSGNALVIHELTPEIVALHQALTKDQQEQTAELVDHLRDQTYQYHFTQTLQHVYSIGPQADINALSAAYEDALHAYEQLHPATQEQLQEHIHELEAYLDIHITQ